MENTGVAIEKGIPHHARTGAPRKYPFYTMEVGDSFLVTGTKSGVGPAMNHAAKKIGNGVKFSQRKVDGGFRVWRIA